ncbi:MAG: hypothetical protein ABI328_00810, partial [Gemmatimonadaceae bacterium]
ALATYRNALAILDTSGRGETMTRTIMQHDYSVSLMALGEVAVAESSFHGIIARLARSDPDAPIPSQPLIHYAHAALFEHHADSAAKYFGILARQAAKEKNNYWQARAVFGLAQAQLQLGDLAHAEESIMRFRRITAKTNVRSSDDQITDVRILDALFALVGGDTARGHDLVVAALHSNGQGAGVHRKTFHSALVLATETALALGEPAEALGYAHDARVQATLDSVTESRSAFVGEAMLLEARALLAGGDSARARTEVARSVIALRNGAGAAHPRTREAERLAVALRQ